MIFFNINENRFMLTEKELIDSIAVNFISNDPKKTIFSSANKSSILFNSTLFIKLLCLTNVIKTINAADAKVSSFELDISSLFKEYILWIVLPGNVLLLQTSGKLFFKRILDEH